MEKSFILENLNCMPSRPKACMESLSAQNNFPNMCKDLRKETSAIVQGWFKSRESPGVSLAERKGC